MYFDHIQTIRSTIAIILLALLPSLAACASNNTESTSHDDLAEVRVLVNEYRVDAELANTVQSRQTGLMDRKHMPTNNGMLFVFDRSETQCMWMKNTLIDLDVAFADELGRILNVEQMKAGTTDIHCSQGKARLALEMNLNWFAERNLGKGDVIKMPAQ